MKQLMEKIELNLPNYYAGDTRLIYLYKHLFEISLKKMFSIKFKDDEMYFFSKIYELLTINLTNKLDLYNTAINNFIIRQ